MVPKNMENDLMSFSDLWKIVKKYRYLIITLPLASILIGLIVISQKPKIWEGFALLQIGQLGQIGNLNLYRQSDESKPVEPIARAIVRLTSPTFYVSLNKNPEIKSQEFSFQQAQLASALTATQMRNSDLVEIRVRAYSKQLAKDLLLATERSVQEAQKELFALGIDPLKKYLEQTTVDLREVESDIEIVKSSSKSKMDAISLIIFIQSRKREKKDLERMKLLIEEQLNPLRSFPSKFLGDVTISESPISPNKKKIIILSFLVGLSLSLLLVFLLDKLNNGKNKN